MTPLRRTKEVAKRSCTFKLASSPLFIPPKFVWWMTGDDSSDDDFMMAASFVCAVRGFWWFD
jgi:hypothetical protein